MNKPEIATILDDGTYGQRPMTDAEYENYLAQIETQDAQEIDDETPGAS